MELPLKMKATIVRCSMGAAGVGIPGAFAAHGDLVAIGAIWTTMLIRLATHAGENLENSKATKIVAGVFAGIGLFKVGFKLANTYFAFTGVGTLPAMIANASVNGGVTYLFGRASGKLFLSEGFRDSTESIVQNLLSLMIGMGIDLPSSDAS
jgi:uncharacterized protein (DUF697 family)